MWWPGVFPSSSLTWHVALQLASWTSRACSNDARLGLTNADYTLLDGWLHQIRKTV
ncbi:hypothetical protein [Sphaerisporangium album]|uniref:hypothetical protein n=1 Tax=Sphaerisporangium album TaxID=509200 RepID=UPI0015F0100E|nr:hypothetical protein [Sphaerisporangium album]